MGLHAYRQGCYSEFDSAERAICIDTLQQPASLLARRLQLQAGRQRRRLLCIHCCTHLTWLGVAPGTWLNSSAAAPATIGADMLVPDMDA